MLFSPDEHAKHPPSTWTVRKHGRQWALCCAGDHPSDFFPTKRDAEAAKVSGQLVALYEKERRWYAGEHVSGWRPFAEVQAENAARAAKVTDR